MVSWDLLSRKIMELDEFILTKKMSVVGILSKEYDYCKFNVKKLEKMFSILIKDYINIISTIVPKKKFEITHSMNPYYTRKIGMSRNEKIKKFIKNNFDRGMAIVSLILSVLSVMISLGKKKVGKDLERVISVQ